MRRSEPNRTMDEFEAYNDWPGDWSIWKSSTHPQGTGAGERALDAAHELAGSTAVEEFAHDLGYPDARHMIEQTETVALPTGGYVYLTTDSDGYWVAWNSALHFGIQRFKSRPAALMALKEDTDVLFLES